MRRHDSEPQELKVIARAPFNIYYEGSAQVVTAINEVGPFDILPGHADFFSILSPGEVIIESEEDSISFNVANGIISVGSNEVLLFVNM